MRLKKVYNIDIQAAKKKKAHVEPYFLKSMIFFIHAVCISCKPGESSGIGFAAWRVW